MIINYLNLFTTFSVSVIITIFIISILHPYLKDFLSTTHGPQRIHQGVVSRLGGITIFISIGFLIFIFNDKNEIQKLFILYVIISTPIFLIGILEDVTQSIGPKTRLLITLFSAILFILFFENLITNVGIQFFDIILDIKVVSIFFTLMCIVFLTQAFNIIDGLNGLSLSTGILSFIVIAIIAYQINDFDTVIISLHIILILAGILFFNFPFGKIFIGDTGAYLIGFYLAISAINFVNKNPDISSFVIAQILIYPSYELFRSFEKIIFKNKSILKPDKKHLHSLIHTKSLKENFYSKLKSNNISSIYVILIQFINCLYIVYFYENTKMILIGILLFILSYEFFYQSINKSLIKRNIKNTL